MRKKKYKKWPGAQRFQKQAEQIRIRMGRDPKTGRPINQQQRELEDGENLSPSKSGEK